ncbi:MAG: site-2 protease family protein [Acidimicrobiales bacterium]
MRATVRLGRVAGIPVGLHWSLLLIGGLLVWDFHDAVDDGTVGTVGPWVMAVAVVACFYAGLVAHELGHALVARRHGVGTVDITLWMLGGVARLAGDSPSPKAEATMALAGPGVSLALGGSLVLAGFGLDAVGAPVLVSDAVWLLAGLNLVLGVFNLVPAFPLDGGRVLRAALWGWRHDRLLGTRIAAGIGTGVGIVAIAAGGWLAVTSDDTISGLWFVLLGGFVIQAARTESAFVRRAAEEARRTAGALCHRPPVLDPALPADEALASHPLDEAHPTYLVGAPGHPDGFVVQELVGMVAGAGHQALREVALPWDAVPVVDASAPAAVVVDAFARSRFRRVRVRLPEGDVGVIGPADLAAAFRAPAPR